MANDLSARKMSIVLERLQLSVSINVKLEIRTVKGVANAPGVYITHSARFLIEPLAFEYAAISIHRVQFVIEDFTSFNEKL